MLAGEYITAQLNSKMKKNFNYQVDFYIRSGNNNPEAIGAYFSVERVKQCQFKILEVSPQIKSGPTISDQWVLASGVLYTSDEYEWIAFGNFSNDGIAFYVDDIAVYELGPGPGPCCPEYTLYQNTYNLPAQTHVQDHIEAGNDLGLPSKGNVIVQSGQNVNFKAGNKIVLKPGFRAEKGSVFRATIEECNVLTNPSGGSIEILSIPTVITPNGDGDNDELCINVKGADSYYIEVYEPNQYTNVIYRNSGEITSNIACVWDGSCNQGSANNCPGGCAISSTVGYKFSVTFYNCDGTEELISKDNLLNITNASSCSGRKANPDISVNNESPGMQKPWAESSFLNNLPGKITITPNPSSNGFFTVAGTPRSITVYNVPGEMVYHSDARALPQSIDISGLPKGMYFVKIKSEYGFSVHKIVYQ